MNDISVKIEQISKMYQLGLIGTSDLRTTITEGAKRLFGKKRNKADKTDEFWALKDISFEVKTGDIIGIVGRNGAGKSTLLKVLSRITEPTKGCITLNGRIASLLEVGTGFHPELTGKENIFLNGSILGMTRQEIKKKYDEIVDFSGIERFIGTPVKRYSSGMYVRLAFAVAAHLEPEILVIDEVLAVGDTEFQKKCLGKMNEVADGGRTILFVSHNMGAVRKLCNKGIMLQQGQLAFNGDINSCVDFYLKESNLGDESEGQITWETENAPGIDEFRLLAVRTTTLNNQIKSVFSTEEPILIEIDYFIKEKVKDMRLNLSILTSDDQILFSGSSDGSESLIKETGEYRCQTILPSSFFNQGNFKIFLQAGCPNVKQLLKGQTFMNIFVEKTISSGLRESTVLPGFVAPTLKWKIEKIN